MKGMLVKDFKLLMKQKQMLVVVAIMAVIFMMSEKGVFSSGLLYCSMLSAILAISTIGYDEFDNGYDFIFTLPVTRKGYAVGKYLFCFLAGGAVWLAVLVVGTVSAWIRGLAVDPSACVMWSAGALLLMCFVLSVMLPVQLKYGSENSKIMSVVVFIIIGAGAGVLMELGKSYNLSAQIQIGTGGIVAAALLGIVILTVVSVGICIRIVEKKQY